MGFRLYKSVGLGKGVRLNLSKTGVGVSAGVRGFRYSVHSSGRHTRTVGVPGSGVYHRQDTMARRGSAGPRPARTASSLPVQMYPKAGVFAPKTEKSFVKGVTQYMKGDPRTALQHFRDSINRDASQDHIAEEYFAAFCHLALDEQEEAIGMLEQVLASPVELPDQLMQKYGVGGHAQVHITPEVVADVAYGNLSAALLLAELYQRSSRPEQAIQLLESLGALAPDPFFGLSLAELYAEGDRWYEVLRVTEGFRANTDDATCQLLAYRAIALRERGLNEAALEILREALKSKKRNPLILNHARYQRALAYEALGRKANARKDFERIFAADPNFADIRDRLDMNVGGRNGN